MILARRSLQLSAWKVKEPSCLIVAWGLLCGVDVGVGFNWYVGGLFLRKARWWNGPEFCMIAVRMLESRNVVGMLGRTPDR